MVIVDNWAINNALTYNIQVQRTLHIHIHKSSPSVLCAHVSQKISFLQTNYYKTKNLAPLEKHFNTSKKNNTACFSFLQYVFNIVENYYFSTLQIKVPRINYSVLCTFTIIEN